MFASHLVIANVYSEKSYPSHSDKLNKNLYQNTDTDMSNIQSVILPSLIQQLRLIH